MKNYRSAAFAIVLTFTILIVVSTGCQGAPSYAGEKAKPDNEINLGWGRSIRMGAETEGELIGLKTANGTQIDRLKMKASPAATMAGGWVPAMDAYGRQQVNFVPILKQYSDNAIGIGNMVFTGLNQLAQTAMPVVGEAVAGHYSVAEIIARQGDIKTQLVNAIGGGVLSIPDARSIMQDIPIFDIEGDVLGHPIVVARIAQLEAQLKAAKEAGGAQPSGAPEPEGGATAPGPQSRIWKPPTKLPMRYAAANEPAMIDGPLSPRRIAQLNRAIDEECGE